MELHGYDQRMGECIKTRLQNQPEAKKIYIAITVGILNQISDLRISKQEMHNQNVERI